MGRVNSISCKLIFGSFVRKESHHFSWSFSKCISGKKIINRISIETLLSFFNEFAFIYTYRQFSGFESPNDFVGFYSVVEIVLHESVPLIFGNLQLYVNALGSGIHFDVTRGFHAGRQNQLKKIFFKFLMTSKNSENFALLFLYICFLFYF